MSAALGQDVQATINYTAAGNMEDYTSTKQVKFVGNVDDTQNVPVSMIIRDARAMLHSGELSLEKQGFTLCHQSTELQSDDVFRSTDLKTNPFEEMKEQQGRATRILRYYKEMHDLIKSETGAAYLHIFGHQARDKSKASDVGLLNPFADVGNVSGYADVVHTDFCSKKSVEKFIQGLSAIKNVFINGGMLGEVRELQPEELAKLFGGRYMLINSWRNISEHPITNNPLACCAADSVEIPADLLRCDVPLKSKTLDIGASTIEVPVPAAEQYRLNSESSGKHRWYYFPQMLKDEVLIFKQFDSDPNASVRFCFHTSFATQTANLDPSRQSVEVRAIAFFPGAQRTVGSEIHIPVLPIPVKQPLSNDSLLGKRPCTATDLTCCTCCCEAPKLPEASPAPQECGCRHASNPYHTCCDACTCTCSSTRALEAPDWLRQFYSCEDTVHSNLELFDAIRGAAQKSLVAWGNALRDDVVLRHTGGKCGSVGEVHGKEAALAAVRSAKVSPLNRCSYLKGYRECLPLSATVDQACCVVSGEFTYDHKLTRDQLILPFSAHITFSKSTKKVISRHTFSDGGVVESFLAERDQLWASLEMKLWAGASHGRLDCSNVEAELDTSALNGLDDAATINKICSLSCILYAPAEWTFLTGL